MQQGKTYVTFVVDRSLSMSRLTAPLKRVFDSLARSTREQAKDLDTRVSLFTFNHNVQAEFIDQNAQNLWALGNYRADGDTALNDAIREAIVSGESMHDAGKSHVSFLINVLTDGQENRSHTSLNEVVRLIDTCQRTGRWTFVFQVPPGAHYQVARTYGVPQDNVREWEATEQGTIETGRMTEQGFSGYFDARRSGLASTKSFYVTPDLAELKPLDIKRKMMDLSRGFLKLPVLQEEEIKPFVEHLTGNAYQTGTGFYQLTKKERVQAGKQLLLMEKGKAAVWGGPEARALLGFPTGASATVTPGNHANYDIFVQSTSNNRKLVRGTKLLVQR